ncbi:hypothetical protein D3C80_1942340 [compost metagenome]
MIAIWIAATISPPPVSGSSLTSLASQVDQHTGMAEYNIPQANIMMAAAAKL